MENLLKDSGNRSAYESGAVRDIQSGKGRCDLLPHREVADLMDYLSRVLISDEAQPRYSPAMILSAISDFNNSGVIAPIYAAIRHFLKIREWDIYTAMMELSIQYEMGADKYGAHNWEKGLPTHCYVSSGIRHLMKYLRGDVDEPHDRAFLFNMMGIVYNYNHNPNLHNEYIDSCKISHIG